MTKYHKLAVEFVKRYDLEQINIKTLTYALQRQGYTIVEFCRGQNEQETQNLLCSLSLEERVKNCDAFTYMDENVRIVFLLENLSEEEKFILLCREQGHIFCGNVGRGIKEKPNIKREYVATEFAHYLLQMANRKGIVGVFFRNPSLGNVVLSVIVIMLFFIIVFVSLFSVVLYNDNKEKQIYETIYAFNDENLNENDYFDVDNNTKDAQNTEDSVDKLESTNENLDKLFTNNKDDILIETKDTQVEQLEQKEQETKTNEQGVYFVTKSGKKYHTQDCSYIKGKDSLIEITDLQINDGNYTACSKCIKK